MTKSRQLKQVLILSSIMLLLIPAVNTLATGTWAFSTLLTHPHFWIVPTNVKTYNYAAKRFKAGTGYKLADGSIGNVERSIYWAASGPGDGTFREVQYVWPRMAYDSTPNTNALDCYAKASTDPAYCTEWRFVEDWERWTYDWNNDQSATVEQYGAKNPATSPWDYQTKILCDNDIQNGVGWPSSQPFAGVIYPNFASGQTASVSPMSNYDPANPNFGCRPQYDANGNNLGTISGGYIAAYRQRDRDSEPAGKYCADYFKAPQYNVEDPTAADIAYKICLAAPRVETIFQVYVQGSVSSVPAIVGCEAVVYASGYPKPTTADAPNSEVVKNWMRNGELRFSRYWSRPNNFGPNAADSWKQDCNQAFNPANQENYFYTGIYKLDTTYFYDTGAAGAATKLVAGSCPAGWTNNSAGSCDPREGADAYGPTQSTCPSGYTAIPYTFNGLKKNKCMSSFP